MPEWNWEHSLQRHKTKLIAYNLTVEWIKVKKNDAPDALLCNPILDPENADTLAEIDTNGYPEMTLTDIRTLHGDTTESIWLQDIHKHVEKYLEYQQLCNLILHGFPAHQSQLQEPCRQFWHILEHLSLDNDLIVYGYRLLILLKLCWQVLSQQHKSHQSTVRTKL